MASPCVVVFKSFDCQYVHDDAVLSGETRVCQEMNPFGDGTMGPSYSSLAESDGTEHVND